MSSEVDAARAVLALMAPRTMDPLNTSANLNPAAIASMPASFSKSVARTFDNNSR
jgi:hypothetical protein